MQTQPQPNDRIALSLPARLVNVIWEVFANTPSLPVPYYTTHEILSEIRQQASGGQPQVQPQPMPNGQDIVTPGVNDATRNPG